MTLLSPGEASFSVTAPVLVIGAGACGLTAALTLREAGRDVLVLERDASPSGSTALSSGMIPAAGTQRQAAAGVTDTPDLMAADIQGKAKDRADPAVTAAVTQVAGSTVDWLDSLPEVDLPLVTGFLYPGHSVERMHAPPNRTGEALMGMLLTAAGRMDIDIVTEAHVTALFAGEDGRVKGVRVTRPDGTVEDIGCDTLILACNGYGGNKTMVAEHIPEMAKADYFGHVGNQGDAVRWGVELGGEAKHMSAYQGHGSVAVPHGILITWALMMEGGIQVNAAGERFSNEHQGYSEQSVAVLAQPGKVAWDVFDDRIHKLGMEFDDYRNASDQRAVVHANSVEDLASRIGVDARKLAAAIAETHAVGTDRFGRDLSVNPGLDAPFYAVKVTGALFHTQGGLRIDGAARVLRSGTDDPLPNLYAGGGAACGVSGPEVSGYLSGNGLLTAVTLGRLAGLDVRKS
ncbi:FAD-dependent oxidoreductase [Hwanghaeella grinnelliae]|uniref:FAD-dependent oxidoreductase n=1 Tax=Hwanghaeella grinnelliae TaxID=2500179 RepID=A0A3S2VKI7_9PROT|nr:FAD-dependent oxidoreductase [Hwanghaeella grinnelliae]RVU34029.1 FAD-dependent oxidoreductase [Hwanghaeella grinnelliae]